MISPYLRLAWNSGTSKSCQLLPAFDADIMAAFETKLEQEMPGLMLKMWQPKIGGWEKELDKLSLFLEILNELRLIQWRTTATWEASGLAVRVVTFTRTEAPAI